MKKKGRFRSKSKSSSSSRSSYTYSSSSRSRSRSHGRRKNTHKRTHNKRKQGKQVKRDRSKDFNPEIETRIQKSKCLTNKYIPKHLRRFFAEVETNPLKLLVTNLPPNAI